jgi:uncharacterized damage-inducible protein DinB
MNEVRRIIDLLNRCFDGKSWHGPSMMKILNGVKSDEAVARPLKGRHTIWELVLHIIAWKKFVKRILVGEIIVVLPDEEDWPLVKSISDVDWKQTLDELRQIHCDLVKTVSGFNKSRLFEMVPGAKYSFYTILHGVIQHDLYHAGQIAVLKKNMKDNIS